MTAPRARQRGFSLVELMVSVVIGLLALVFALNMVGSAEKNRQSALGGSDEMQNGMAALFSLANDAGMAGYGINDPIINGCDTVFSDNGGAGYKLAPATRGTTTIHPLAPVVIEAHGTAPDRITFYAGSSPAGTPTVMLSDDYASGPTVKIAADASYGFSQYDVIVVAPDQAGGQCALAQLATQPATGQPLSVAQGSLLRFNTGNLGASFSGSAARVFDLGAPGSLAFRSWSVANGYLQLQGTDDGGTAAPATVAEDVVSIKAEYGFDMRVGSAFQPTGTGGMQVNQWSPTMLDADHSGVTGDAGDYQRVAAVRLAVVARSKAYERVSANCTATQPTVFATAVPQGVTVAAQTVSVAVAGDPVDWKCYHYRVFETIVSVRNAAWRP